MMTELYWIYGPWPGKLAIAPRPRGGDWLEDEISHWHSAGVDTVLSVLVPKEEKDLNLLEEQQLAKRHGIKFLSLPIPDRQVPSSESDATKTLEKLELELDSGKNVVVHCRQGVGRSGLIASCLLVMKGFSPQAAVEAVSASRGVEVPETKQQRTWIDHYSSLKESTR